MRAIYLLAGVLLVTFVGACGKGGGGIDFIGWRGARTFQVTLSGGTLAGRLLTVVINDLTRAATPSEVSVTLTSDDGTFNSTALAVSELSENRIGGTATVGDDRYTVVIDIAADGQSITVAIGNVAVVGSGTF